MRLSAYVEPDRPDRDAILAAIKRAKAKGLDEVPVTLPSCGCVLVLRKAIVLGVEGYLPARFEGPAPRLRKGECDG
jgi:hypothetical protein